MVVMISRHGLTPASDSTLCGRHTVLLGQIISLLYAANLVKVRPQLALMMIQSDGRLFGHRGRQVK
jgi:hypothetical protein